jgi:hypothetical protein
MVLRRFVLCVLAPVALAAFQTAQAQPVRACPEGQAVNSLHPNGTPVQCIPVPPPVDISGLKQAINQESAERSAADAEIRASINELNETRISGRYVFSGPTICLTSTFGFNEDLTPRASTDPARAAVVGPITLFTTGFRTFNEDGTGTVQVDTQSVGHPTIFVTSTGFAGVGTLLGQPGQPNRPSGNVNVASQTGTFTWHVTDGKLFIADATGLSGTFSAGPFTGCTARNDNLPPMVGVLAKDLRTISIGNEGVAEESLTITCNGAVVSSGPRICHRQRLLQKM